MNSPATPRKQGIGTFDATMLVMGGIVGSGIFNTPTGIAALLPSTPLILAAWGFGGLVALAGAFVYADLAARHPAGGGQYAYLRDALHPILGFLYAWAEILVVQTGGLAASAVATARYLRVVVSFPVSDATVAIAVLAILTGINCAGVRAGNVAQRTFMLLKIAAILGVIACGIAILGHSGAAPAAAHIASSPVSHPSALAFGAALTMVAFSYGGWQTASFATTELRDPARDLARAMVYGVGGVCALYIAINVVMVAALGPHGLAASPAPAATLVSSVLGADGQIMALVVAVSAAGFLSQGLFAVPRLYEAMAADGRTIKLLGRVSPRTGVPTAAILLQGILCAIVTLSGTYEQILSYVESVDLIFYGIAGVSLCVFRSRRFAASAAGVVGERATGFNVPGHPWTTVFFIVACWSVALATIRANPRQGLTGLGILALGIPVFLLSQRRLRVSEGI